MTEHEITFIYSGSWKADVKVTNGEINWEAESYSRQAKFMVEAYCSCGKTFVSDKKAHDHLKDVRDEQLERQENLVGESSE